MLDAVIGFSGFPLRIASYLGLCVSFLGGLYFLYVLAVYVLGNSTIPGWTSVLATVLVLGGVQLACVGIIGQYVGPRTYR